MTLIIGMIHGIWILFLVFFLRSICLRPDSYDVIPGYERYCTSDWFWPAHAPYGKGDPPEVSGRAILFLYLPLISWFFYSGWIRYRFLVIATEDSVRFIGNGTWMTVKAVSAMVHSLILGLFLMMSSRSSMMISATEFRLMAGKKRSEKWKKITTLLLISSLVFAPIRCASLNYYGTADQDRIIFHPFGFGKEMVFAYDELEDVSTAYTPDGSSLRHCILTNKAGDTFDICDNYIDIDAPFRDNSIQKYLIRQLEERGWQIEEKREPQPGK